MNKTISIYLQDTGSNALIDIPCRLYKGSYKDKQINVYVPKSLLFEAEDTSLVNTINIGAILTAENGTQTTTVPYYPNYVQDEIVNGVEYAVYSLSMPNTFTAFVGTQTIVVNVVNIDNTDTTSPLVLEITTTQSVALTINPSANISQEEVIEADQVTLINAELQDIQETLTEKQNIQDATLPTSNKTVSGAMNIISDAVDTNTSTIGTQGLAITQLQTDVAELQAKMAGAEIPVGSMSGSSMPTAQELNAEVVTQTGEQPEPNNVILFTLEIAWATDRVFKFVYVSPTYTNAADTLYPSGLVGWTYYEIPAIEHARNGTYGSVQGTYGIDSPNETLFNIVDGEIKDVYYKDNNNNYSNVRASLNSIKQTQDDIIYGTQVVAQSTKTIQDQLGNVINTTYAEASEVYTKTQSDAKYLSKTYTNVYYYAADGLVDDVPTTPASGIQFTQLVDTIGETQICSCGRTTTGDYHFTKNSSDNSSIVLATDVDCTQQFRLETYANSTILAADLSDVMEFTANTPQTLDITTIYSDLGTQEIDVPIGSTITKVLYAISTDTTEKTVYLYSNTTYPSTYQLSAQSIVLTVNTINGLDAINIDETEWTDNGDDTYTVVIPQTRHKQPASTRYILELQKQLTANSYQYIAFTPIVADSGDITITTNEAIDCVLLIGSTVSNDDTWGEITITAENYYQSSNIPYPKSIITFDTDTAQTGLSLELMNNDNAKEIKLVGKATSQTLLNASINIYTEANATIYNVPTGTIEISGNIDGDIGTIYYAGTSNNITNYIFVPAKKDNTIYAKGSALNIAGNLSITSLPPTGVINKGSSDLFLFAVNPNTANAALVIESFSNTSKAVKFFLDFGTATASGNGTLTIKLDSTTIATKTYSSGDALSTLAVSTIMAGEAEGRITITSTFSSAITANWQLCVLDIGKQKVSEFNNAFDLSTGTQWDIDYSNNTIQLKD